MADPIPTVRFDGEAFVTGVASTTQQILLRDRDTALDYAIEFDVRVVATDVVEKRRAATREFITLASETPANARFKGTLSKVLSFDRSIANGDRFGQITLGWGESEFLNADGDYDDLVGGVAVDGQRIVVKVAAADSPYRSFQTLFDGTCRGFTLGQGVMRLKVRDNAFKLDVPAQPRTYAGTAALEGPPELEGQPKPKLFGFGSNITPVQVEPSKLLYQINDGPILAVDAVYDRAVALAFARDYPSSGELRSASTGAAGSGKAIEAGEYATCLAQGFIRLGGAPAGTITCDARGDKTGGSYVETTAGILRRLVTSAATVLTDADLALYSFQTVDMLQPAPVGYYLDGSQSVTVADVVADLMGGIGGWGGMRRDGKFEVGVFVAPSGMPTARYSRIDIASFEPEALPDALSPPPYRWRIGYGRNWTVQTDVDGQRGVSANRVAYLATALRYAVSSTTRAASIQADHPLAQDAAPIDAFFRDAPDASAEANRLLLLYGSERGAYRLTLQVHPFLHEVGEVIHVTDERYGFGQGRLVRIVSVSDDAEADTIELVVFG